MATDPGAASSALALESDTRARAGSRRVSMPRGFVLRRLLVGADTFAIAMALLAVVRHHVFSDFVVGLGLLPVWILLFKVYGLYDRDGKRVSHSTVDDVPWVFHALVLGSLGLWTYYRVLPVQHLDLLETIGFFAIAFTAILLARSLVRRFLTVATHPERVLLVADGAISRLLVRKMQTHPEYGLAPVGCLELESGSASAGIDLRALGTLDQFEQVCEEARIQRIVVGPTLEQDALIDLVRRASGMQVPISLVPNVVDVLGPSVEIDDVEGVTVLGINPPLLNRSSRWLKRAMDLTVACTAALLLAPLLALIALVVKLTSPGPALFAQRRLGREGQTFRVYKFRTMVADAEQRLEALKAHSQDPNWLLIENDPRITRFGHFLRRTSLDELPQLWNVIKGDMSLVGPRPLTAADHEQVASWGRRRLHLTPGITGVWQVLGRTTIPFEEMVKLDYLYVTNWSLWGDVRLLIRTLPSVLRRRGAN